MERRTLVLRNETAFASRGEGAHSLARSRARAPRVIYPLLSPASLRARPAGCRSRRGKWRGALRSSALLASLVRPRASSERRGGNRLASCAAASLAAARARYGFALRLDSGPFRDSTESGSDSAECCSYRETVDPVYLADLSPCLRISLRGFPAREVDVEESRSPFARSAVVFLAAVAVDTSHYPIVGRGTSLSSVVCALLGYAVTHARMDKQRRRGTAQ